MNSTAYQSDREIYQSIQSFRAKQGRARLLPASKGKASKRKKIEKDRQDMKIYWRLLQRLSFFFILFLLSVSDISAESLFKGREIYLNNDENSEFRIGLTGTTAGYNYLALIEDAKQESISLGKLGYWELVEDPPSVLRNYGLQLIIENSFKGNFQIEFNYDQKTHNIDYRIKEGPIHVKLDNSEYYPKLIIEGVASVAQLLEEVILSSDSNNLLFFDFNSFDVDLRKHYGDIKRLIEGTGSNHYFFYYESGGYNSYYFKTYKDVSQLDIEKMGLSLEDGTLEYYQKILDNLKSRFGSEFADRLIIVSRFGNEYSNELKNYAAEIGMSEDMEVIFWDYDQIQ